MSQKVQTEKKYITKNKAAGIAAVCLVIGFVGGVVYSTYTPVPGAAQRPAAAPVASLPAVMSPEATGRILALEQKVSLDPADLAAWLELGNLYFDSGKPESAIRAYTKYLDQNPSNPDVWTDLGVMYRQVGQPGEAIKCFDRALAVNPDHQQSRYNKGVVLLHDLKEADSAFKEWEILAEKNRFFRTPDGRLIQDIIKNK